MSRRPDIDRAYTYRPATMEDVPLIEEIMEASMSQLMNGFLTPAQIEASAEVMGLDTRLISDETYYLVLEGDAVVGCGGWSARATLYGGNHTPGRDASMLVPGRDAARIRAMYTHPDHVRKGIGRLIMNICEDEAVKAGFDRAELMATMPGVPLYEACGYEIVREESAKTEGGVSVPLRLMERKLR